MIRFILFFLVLAIIAPADEPSTMEDSVQRFYDYKIPAIDFVDITGEDACHFINLLFSQSDPPATFKVICGGDEKFKNQLFSLKAKDIGVYDAMAKIADKLNADILIKRDQVILVPTK